MILMHEEITDSLVDERCKIVREKAESHKKIMYLENHGNKDNHKDLEKILPYMTEFFN